MEAHEEKQRIIIDHHLGRKNCFQTKTNDVNPLAVKDFMRLVATQRPYGGQEVQNQ